MSQSDTVASVRNRVRTSAVKPVAKPNAEVTPEMLEMAEAYFRLNAAKNEAAREAERAFKRLNSLMGVAEIERFEFMVGNQLVEAVIEPSTTKDVDVYALRKKVSEADFMDAICATQTAVKDKFGVNILNSVLVEKEKPAALKVRTPKVKA
jgi:hypothetical protein